MGWTRERDRRGRVAVQQERKGKGREREREKKGKRERNQRREHPTIVVSRIQKWRMKTIEILDLRNVTSVGGGKSHGSRV